MHHFKATSRRVFFEKCLDFSNFPNEVSLYNVLLIVCLDGICLTQHKPLITRMTLKVSQTNCGLFCTEQRIIKQFVIQMFTLDGTQHYLQRTTWSELCQSFLKNN